MKKVLSRLTKGFMTVAVAVAMTATLMPASATVFAKTSKAQKKANKAYAKAIKKNKIAKFDEYSLLEVTGGGTKELIVRNSQGTGKKGRNLNIYTYSKGKVKKIWSTSDQAIVYNKKQKTIVDLQYMGQDSEMGTYDAAYDIYKYNGKKIVKKGSYFCNIKYHYKGKKLVYDKKEYSKRLKGHKLKKISEKEYNSATKESYGVWSYNSATKKELIKKLNK